MIRFEAVSRSFDGPDGRQVLAVRGLNLEVGRGETVCLIGSSGCGKTTTLRMVNRLEEADSGTIRVEGRDVMELDPIRLRRRIGYVIQHGGLFPHLDVRRNVGLMCALEGWPEERTRERVNALLERVRLDPDEFGERFPGELSGGQRQRVGVARALALDPEIVLLDEPFGALDPITRGQLQQEFLELDRQVAKTVLMVSHDMDEAFLLADRVALMEEGELVQIGTLEDFRTRPNSEFVSDFLEKTLRVP